jgi:hypothetical protein
MNTMKTLMLAGFAALSLGAGSAMAQNESYSMPTPDYWSHQNRPEVKAPPAAANQVQSGSSDVFAPQTGAGAVSPYNYGTLANPG